MSPLPPRGWGYKGSGVGTPKRPASPSSGGVSIAASSGMRAAFLGGPFNGCRTELTRTPPELTIQGVVYQRIDDPDTGEYLGGYCCQMESVWPADD